MNDLTEECRRLICEATHEATNTSKLFLKNAKIRILRKDGTKIVLNAGNETNILTVQYDGNGRVRSSWSEKGPLMWFMGLFQKIGEILLGILRTGGQLAIKGAGAPIP